MSRHITLPAVVLLALMTMLSACTRVVVVDTPMEALPKATIASGDAGEGWWDIEFKMSWVEDEEPDWFIDTLIADQVCAPAIAAHADFIALWRFHRRAYPDDIGHRFTLRVFADQLSVEQVLKDIEGSSVLHWLETDGWVESVKMVQRPRLDDPPVARASGVRWSPEIKASWPWFIMGVSQAWLSMIMEVSKEQGFEGTSKWALLDHYREVNERVSVQWQQFGQDAYLHHLSGIFGYVPLVIRGEYLKRF